MFKKLTAILMPFVLAPLGLLLAPAIARADQTRWTPLRKCVFSSDSTKHVNWTAIIVVRSSDNAAHLTRVIFGTHPEDERIRQFAVWESRKLNGVETRYSQQTYNFIPTVLSWDSLLLYEVLPTTWISTLGNRYINVWFYDSSGRVCTDKIEF